MASRPEPRARDAGVALDSAFRRRWSRRVRVEVTVLGWLLALVLRVLYATLRVRWSDPAGIVGRHARGERFVFATWHDGLLVLPLVLRRVPGRYRPRVLLSWHRDAEIAAQAARRFGVGAIRGSSTRGGIGALRGLLDAYRAGDDVVMVPDGPRGPRHEAKAGVVQLARAVGTTIVPLAVAVSPCRRLRSWDRLLIPLPFARVAFRVGLPVALDDVGADPRARVQRALEATVAEAERMLAGAAT